MESACEEIQRACRLGDLPLLQQALSKFPEGINAKDSKLGWTCLYRSVICGHLNTSEYLLQSKADPNVKTKMGDTALHQAADNKQYKLAELLIEYSADPDLQQNDGETPLHLASFKGDAEMVKLLLGHNANPNVQNFTFGKTPLHYAVDYCYTSIIKSLIKHGASSELKDKLGKSAKDVARSPEIQGMLNGVLNPSPEPSDFVEKQSLSAVSPIYSRRNSDLSINSDSKSVEYQVKQLDDIHRKIREKVRGNGDTQKISCQSNNTSCMFEPEGEKSSYGVFFSREKIISFGGTDRNPELLNFLNKNHLEEICGPLIAAGYDDLAQLSFQMSSKSPITEKTLKEIGIYKQGLRKRLLVALDGLSHKENLMKSPKKSQSFYCCTANVPAHFWVAPGLSKWLEGLNLKETHQKFLDSGYTELEDMVKTVGTAWEITADDLKDIGIDKLGYRHRILSKLKEEAGGLPQSKGVLIEKNSNTAACESCIIS